MKLISLTMIACFGATAALAHVGHLGGMAAHDHWVAGAAIGVAAAITLWGVIKGKSKQAEETSDEAEPEEETA